MRTNKLINLLADGVVEKVSTTFMYLYEIEDEHKLSGLLVQILTSGQVEPFVADFIYHMIHKGYGQVLSAAEIKALNAALVLIEDKLDL